MFHAMILGWAGFILDYSRARQGVQYEVAANTQNHHESERDRQYVCNYKTDASVEENDETCLSCARRSENGHEPIVANRNRELDK